jgi:hypothetical protein
LAQLLGQLVVCLTFSEEGLMNAAAASAAGRVLSCAPFKHA